MTETIPQAKPKHTGKIILGIVFGLLLLLGTFAAGFAAGAVFIVWQDSNTDWGMMDDGYTDDIYYDDDCGGMGCAVSLKPAIYLYPTKTVSATVQLDYDGEIITDIPAYDAALGGWQVQAQPDGTLLAADGKQYPYLFWEGKPTNPDRYKNPTAGFVVAGQDTEKFLRSVLPRLGLIETEYEEFIEFWQPKLQSNPYTLIHFAGADYKAEARLSVEPRPDSVLRIYMVTKALEKPIHIKPQVLVTPQREGFTVVEWGGTILD